MPRIVFQRLERAPPSQGHAHSADNPPPEPTSWRPLLAGHSNLSPGCLVSLPLPPQVTSWNQGCLVPMNKMGVRSQTKSLWFRSSREEWSPGTLGGGGGEWCLPGCCLPVVPDGKLGWGVLNPLENLMDLWPFFAEICACACTPGSPVQLQRAHRPLDSAHWSCVCVMFYLCALCRQDPKHGQEGEKSEDLSWSWHELHFLELCIVTLDVQGLTCLLGI